VTNSLPLPPVAPSQTLSPIFLIELYAVAGITRTSVHQRGVPRGTASSMEPSSARILPVEGPFKDLGEFRFRVATSYVPSLVFRKFAESLSATILPIV